MCSSLERPHGADDCAQAAGAGMFKFRVNSPSSGNNIGFSHGRHPGTIYKPKGEAGRKTKNGKVGFDARKKIHAPRYVWRAMRVRFSRPMLHLTCANVTN
jgi:hypothetical protein